MGRLRALAVAGAGLGGLLLLGACSHQAELLKLKPQYRLGYDDKGESAALAYGAPGSDDLALMLECPKGSGRIELSDTAFGKSATTVVLTSGGRATRVAVRLSDAQDGSNEPQEIVGHLTSRAQALQAFRRSGVLDVSGRSKHYVITVQPDHKAGVERFFRECG